MRRSDRAWYCVRMPRGVPVSLSSTRAVARASPLAGLVLQPSSFGSGQIHLMEWAEDDGAYYIFGLAANPALDPLQQF